MPTVKVEFHRLAKNEYDAAVKWYAARSTNAADGFRAAVGAAILEIPNDRNRWLDYPVRTDGQEFADFHTSWYAARAPWTR